MDERFLATVGFSVLLLAGGCIGNEDGATSRSPGVGAGMGRMGFHMDVAYDSITAVRYEVTSNGEVVAERTVVLEREGLPTSMLPGASPEHRFADAYFVLEPGTYGVSVVLLEGEEPDWTISDQCGSVVAPAVEVSPGQTTEITLVSQCASIGSGGLDVVVTTNHVPKITDLQFDPSKFVVVCEPLQVTVTAAEHDNDALGYTWEVTGPDGSDYDATGEQAVLSFEARTAGDYEATVTVCDSLPELYRACASLTFPIHVTLGDDDGNGVGDLCEDQPCVPTCGYRECGPDPTCGVSCGSCDEGYVCNGLGYCEPDQQCVPYCEGRQCGPDPDCGISCGTCDEGAICSDDGICEIITGRAVTIQDHVLVHGAGVVLQGDDMARDDNMQGLTRLRFNDNGTTFCGETTNNDNGESYVVELIDETHPVIAGLTGFRFLYGDDIDNTTPIEDAAVKVLAWANLPASQGRCPPPLADECERVPVVAAYDPSARTEGT